MLIILDLLLYEPTLVIEGLFLVCPLALSILSKFPCKEFVSKPVSKDDLRRYF